MFRRQSCIIGENSLSLFTKRVSAVLHTLSINKVTIFFCAFINWIFSYVKLS